MTQVTGPDGRWVRFDYDAALRITKAYDNAGRTVGYAYNAEGRLSSVTDPEGRLTSYTYDAAGRMATVTDNRRIAYLTNQYDADGRVSRQTLADGGVYQFAYTKDASGKVIKTTVTDPRNVVRVVEFNTAGFPIKDTRNATGTPVMSATYAREAVTNRLLSSTDQSGRKTAYRYDSVGNVAEVTRLAGTANAVSTTYTYTPIFNGLASVTDPLMHATRYAYDSRGRLISVRDATDRVWLVGYVGSSPLADSLDGSGRQEVDVHLQRRQALIHARSARACRAAVHRRRWTDGRSQGCAGRFSRLSYDRSDLLKQTTAPDGASTAFDYDANGNLLKLTMPRRTSSRSPMTRWTGAHPYRWPPEGRPPGVRPRRKSEPSARTAKDRSRPTATTTSTALCSSASARVAQSPRRRTRAGSISPTTPRVASPSRPIRQGAP